MIYLILGLVLLVILLLVINFLYYKNKFNFYFLKVEEADNNIELILEKKIEILLKIAKIIDKDMLEYISIREMNALKFIYKYKFNFRFF